MPWKTLSEQLSLSNVIGEFTLEESRAFADLAVLIMLADERVTTQELEELSALLEALPLGDEDEIEEKMADHLAYSRQTVERAMDEEEVDMFIQQTSAKIVGREHREHALELLAVLAYSDGVAASEEDICYRIGRAFGFDDDAVEDALMHGSLDSIAD